MLHLHVGIFMAPIYIYMYDAALYRWEKKTFLTDTYILARISIHLYIYKLIIRYIIKIRVYMTALSRRKNR